MSWLQSIDVAVFRFINLTLNHPILDPVIPLFSGFPGFWPAVILLVVILLFKGGRRERLFVCTLIIVLALGESFVIAPMKEAVGRLRPFNIVAGTHLMVGMGGSGSMPSSHTSTWFAVATVAYLFYRRSWRFMLPLACLVGFSRIYVGVHYPSDVLAGAILGAGYGATFAWLLNALWQRIGSEWFPEWWRQMPSLTTNGHEWTRMELTEEPLTPALSPSDGERELGQSLAPRPQSGPRSSLADAQERVPTGIQELQWLRLGYLFIGVILLVQLIYLASGRIELCTDEAYQWLWSKHLALSYYSKPPMIAYLQFLGTSLWGDTEFGARFLSPLMAAMLSLLLLRFFAREVNARAGFWLVVTLHCTPLLAVGGTLITVDPPLVLFWVAAMLAGWRAVQPGSTTRHWLWAGLWMGLGFLSKYTALFQILCWALFFLLWKPARLQLRRAGPYLALLILAVSALPVVIWNAQHGWITVHHVAYDNAGLGEPWQPTLRFFGEFLGSEAGLLNPVFFGAILWALCAFWRRHRQNPLLLYFFCMGAPVFFIYMLFTGYKRVLPNWIAPSVVPLFCLMVIYFDDRWRQGARAVKGWLTAGVVIGLAAVVLLHDTNLTQKLFGRTLPISLDPLRRVRAWSETAQVVGQARAQLLAEGKPVFIIATHYGLAGEFSFYLPEIKAVIKKQTLVYCPTTPVPGNQFYFWPGYIPEYHGENAIFVHELDSPGLAKGWFLKWLQGRSDLYDAAPMASSIPPPDLLKEFDSVTPLPVAEIQSNGRTYRRLQLFACRNLH